VPLITLEPIEWNSKASLRERISCAKSVGEGGKRRGYQKSQGLYSSQLNEKSLNLQLQMSKDKAEKPREEDGREASTIYVI